MQFHFATVSVPGAFHNNPEQTYSISIALHPNVFQFFQCSLTSL